MSDILPKSDQKIIDEIFPVWESILIDGEETPYLISSNGDVYNKKFNRYLTWDISNKTGYASVKLSHNNKLISFRISRLVAIAFVPNPDNKPEVNHKDGNKLNNRDWNLEWMTQSENLQHAKENGLVKRGSDVSEYSEETVHEICRLLQNGEYPSEISKKVGVPRHLPARIKYSGAWNHIASQYNFPGAYTLPKPPRVYTIRIIHDICALLEKKYNDQYISEKLDVPLPLIGSIRREESWTSISHHYKIPDSVRELNGRYSDEDIHEVCVLFEQGKSPVDVFRIVKVVPYGTIEAIKRRISHREISKQYQIPEPRPVRSPLRDVVDPLLEEGIRDVNDIMKKANIDMNPKNKMRVTNLKHKYLKRILKPKVDRPSNPYRDKIITLFDNGVMDNDIIIDILSIPDTKNNRGYINTLRRRYNQSKS